MKPIAYYLGSLRLSTLGIKIAVGAISGLLLACATTPAHAATYTFQNIVDPADATFNQELGISNSGLISGYFGSGAPGHPNQGYTIAAPYTSFTNENFPMSMQTQVTGLDNSGTTVGFWSDTNKGVGMAAISGSPTSAGLSPT